MRNNHPMMRTNGCKMTILIGEARDPVGKLMYVCDSQRQKGRAAGGWSRANT